MSATISTVRPEDTAGPINRIMRQNQLDKKDIGPKNAKASQEVHGIGEFFCEKCNRPWKSNFSWMRINLYNQMVEYKWSMKCKHCGTPEKPTFTTDETEILIQYAICKIMLKYQLDNRDIDPKDPRQRQVVHGFGEFQCSGCTRGCSWKSFFSWMRINLYDQMVEYKWSMKCKKCLTPEKPTFSTEETERLIERAVCKYKRIDYVPPEGSDKERRFGPRKDPHFNLLCEKCGYGSTQCWLYYTKH